MGGNNKNNGWLLIRNKYRRQWNDIYGLVIEKNKTSQPVKTFYNQWKYPLTLKAKLRHLTLSKSWDNLSPIYLHYKRCSKEVIQGEEKVNERRESGKVTRREGSAQSCFLEPQGRRLNEQVTTDSETIWAWEKQSPCSEVPECHPAITLHQTWPWNI